MSGLANLSLKNRALIALVTVFVMIFGVITTTQLKQELIPSLTIPTAVVFTTYPGASPQVVEERVTTPVEQAVLGLSGLESSSSQSSTGVSTVTVNMAYGTNMSVVQQDLQAAISRIEGALPDDAAFQVVTGSTEDFPVIQLSVTDDSSTAGTPSAGLSDRLDTSVVPELEKVAGVRAVSVAGAPEPRVLIDLDLDKLTEAGLPPTAINEALQASGAVVAAGSLGEGQRTLAVTVGARLASAKDVGALVMVNAAGQETTIDEVAKVTDSAAPATSIARTNGKKSLSLSITKTPDGNTVEVSRSINALLPELREKLGNGAQFTIVFDQAPFITKSIEDLATEGGLGLVMAVVVILVFLLSVRSTLVTAISIPVSVLIALIGLRVADFSLNILTLGALTIAIGRVVDDSIVVIENIKRHLSYGKPKLRAITTAVREVATAVTAATITTVAVFLPISFVGGQVGELFRPFAVTTSLALAASLLVALTIVPVLAYWFLKSPREKVDPDEVREAAEAKERRGLLQRAYVPILRGAVKHPVITVFLAILILAGTGALTPYVQQNFLGSTGQNTLNVTQKFEPSLSLKTKSFRAQQVEEVLQKVPGVETVQTTVGSSGGTEAAFSGNSNDSASFALTSLPDADQTAVENSVRSELDKLTDLGDLTVSTSTGFGSSNVEVIISAPDPARLTEATEAVEEKMKTLGPVAEVSSSLAADQPTIQVTVDRSKAAEAGLTDSMIAETLKGVLAPAKVGSIEADGQTQDVVLSSGDAPVGVGELEDVLITGNAGAVKLSKIATVEEVPVATSIAHTDGQRSATVSLTPKGQDLAPVNTAVTTALAELDLPEGVDAEIGGVTADQEEAYVQLGLALIVAIAIVYTVMVATFKSLIQPLILLVSVPFAATGALVALVITDTPMGVPSLIGVLMLVGIVVTNAIVLIDLVNHYRNQGQSIEDALLNGARQRLRPILMTAMATIFALVPMALGVTGGGVFISRPLAIVVIGGLISSTLLTLILVPVLYELIERRKRNRVLKREAKRNRTPPPPPPPLPPAPQSPAPRRAAPESGYRPPRASAIGEPYVRAGSLRQDQDD